LGPPGRYRPRPARRPPDQGPAQAALTDGGRPSGDPHARQ
jgi:hypothetical protein